MWISRVIQPPWSLHTSKTWVVTKCARHLVKVLQDKHLPFSYHFQKKWPPQRTWTLAWLDALFWQLLVFKFWADELYGGTKVRKPRQVTPRETSFCNPGWNDVFDAIVCLSYLLMRSFAQLIGMLRPRYLDLNARKYQARSSHDKERSHKARS